MFERSLTNLALALDFTTPFSIFNSATVEQMHHRLMKRTREQVAEPVPELSRSQASRKAFLKLSKDFTVPVVIRGTEEQKKRYSILKEASWWNTNYGQQPVMTVSARGRLQETIQEFLSGTHESYVTGTSAILDRCPELREIMVDPLIPRFSPDKPDIQPTVRQMFMGYRNQGTPIHSAIGGGLFTQLTGKKHWVLIPPSQLPHVRPRLRPNGFVAVTKTIQTNQRGSGVPWYNKLIRQSVILEPGDLLLVPPWYWHGVENIADENELVIGISSRYPSPKRALKASKTLTILAGIHNLRATLPFATQGEDIGIKLEETLLAGPENNYRELSLG